MPGPMHFGVCNPRKQTETKTPMHEWPILDQVIFDDDSQTATKEQIVVYNVGFNQFRLQFNCKNYENDLFVCFLCWLANI